MNTSFLQQLARSFTQLMKVLLAILLIGFGFEVGFAQPTPARQMPKILTISEGVVWRSSDKQDPAGNHIPPWKQVEITNLGFKQAPRIGQRVTVVPIDVKAAIIDLAIIKTTPRANCDMSGPTSWWEVELEPVQQKEYFEMTKPDRREEVPFDVVIFYPAVKFARQLRRDELKKDLPKGVYLNTVKAAIDLTNDAVPDVVITEYCCLQPAVKADECDHTCGKTFQKVRNCWKLVDTSSPC